MPVTFTSRQAYYNHLRSGKLTSQKDRIMAYFIREDRPMTRHEVVDLYFCIPTGTGPGSYIARDGGSPIHWQSAGARISELVAKPDEYLIVIYEGEDPVTREPNVQFLVPNTEKWQARRQFQARDFDPKKYQQANLI